VDAVVTGLSLSVRDVTVRERRKRELAEQRQRLAAVEERFGEVTVLALRQVSRPEAAADRLPAPPQWPARGLRRPSGRGILDGLSRPGSPGAEAPEIRVVPELGESSSRLPTEFRPNRDRFSKITKAVLELGSGEA